LQCEPDGCGGGAHGDGEERDEGDKGDREDEEINDRGEETRAKAPWGGADWVAATDRGSFAAERRAEVRDRVKRLHNPKRRVGLIEFAARGRLVGAGAACGDFGHVVVFAFDGSSGEAAENR